eukprot:EG_transcript_28610
MYARHSNVRSSPKPSSKRLRVDGSNDIKETPPSKRMKTPSKVARRLIVSTPEPPAEALVALEGCSTPEGQTIKVRTSSERSKGDVQPRALDLDSSGSSCGKRKTPKAQVSGANPSPQVESLASSPSPGTAAGKLPTGATPKKSPFKDREEEREWDAATEEFRRHQLDYFKKIDNTPL